MSAYPINPELMMCSNERMWKETVMAQFKVLSWHLLGETEKNQKKKQNMHTNFWW
jgi:hypothetical protein